MPELPSLWKRAPVTPIPPCWGIRELKCHIVPEELFQAYITPVQTHSKANTFCRAVPGLSSPCVTGAQHPLHLLQAPAERGGGRCKPVVIPSPHLLHPGCRRAAITGRLSKLSPSQEQTVLTLLSSLQSSVGKSLIRIQRKSIAVQMCSWAPCPEQGQRGASGVAGQKGGLVGYKSHGKEVILLSDISTIRGIGW